MNRIIAVPGDETPRNTEFNSMFVNSLRKFHPDIEVRFFPNIQGDPDYWYRAKPIIACQLFEEGYEHLIIADNDQVIAGDISELLNDTDSYDIGVVLNDPSWPIQVWDISHPNYYNNGLVIVKSKEFAKHWRKLCFTPHFKNYQYREQDFLTLLCSDYFNYKVKVLDNNSSVYGEVLKPQWINSFIRDDKIFVKIPNNSLGNPDGEIQLKIIHFGGGNTPDKGKYRLKFPPEVSDHIDRLIK